MDYLNYIHEHMPMRRKKTQKKVFTDWAIEEAQKLGYNAYVRKDGDKGQHNNVEIGNAATAKVIFTAHYDTPGESIFPNLMMPAKPLLGKIYAVLVILPLLALSLGVAFGVMSLFETETFNMADSMLYRGITILIYLVLYGGIFWRFYNLGVPNKSNKNDNTSGVAGVFTIMEKLPEGARKNVAFLLFDNEEWGKKGSAAYAKANEKVKKNTLLVNMDCIGYGDQLVSIVTDRAMAHPLYAALAGGVAEQKLPLTILNAKHAKANSDQANFDCGIALLTGKKNCLVGFITHRIHTRFDTVASSENVYEIASALADFAAKIR